MAQMEQLSPGSFEEAYATSIIAADTLAGGDIGSPNEEDHFIADNWSATETRFPDIYHSKEASALRAQGGANPKINSELVKRFVSEHNLLDRPNDAVRLSADFDNGRQVFIRNQMAAMQLIIKRASALASGDNPPSYEDLYGSVTGEAPALIPHKERQEALREALAGVGLEGSDLAALTRQWEKRQVIPASEFLARAKEVSAELRELTREKLLRQIDFPVPGDPHLEGFRFDGMQYRTVNNVGYTGSNVYLGGLSPDGKPALRAINTYNTDHPVNEHGIIGLYAHESDPGHYINSAVNDILVRSGVKGFERTMGTMCTPQVAFQEGWAQVGLAMLHGGRRQDVIDKFGPDWAVHYALEDLQDAGKHNASIIYQLHRRPIEEVQRHLADDLVMSAPITKKLSGGWAQHPLVGPMYGSAYEKGRVALDQAIAQKGLAWTIRTGLQVDAPIELIGLKEKLAS